LSVLVLNAKGIDDLPHCLVLPLFKKHAYLVKFKGLLGPILKTFPRVRGRFATDPVVLIKAVGKSGRPNKLGHIPMATGPITLKKKRRMLRDFQGINFDTSGPNSKVPVDHTNCLSLYEYQFVCSL